MKFNVYLLLQGPAGTTEAPHSGNPCEAENLGSMLADIAEYLIENPIMEVMGLTVNYKGIRVEEVEE